jgi:hypothetical protein
MTHQKVKEMVYQMLYDLHQHGYIKQDCKGKLVVSDECIKELIQTVKLNLKEESKKKPKTINNTGMGFGQ